MTARQSHLGPTRSRVLGVLREADEPVGAAEVAGRLGIHPNSARFHLDALADAGMVERRSEGRSVPGRPKVLVIDDELGPRESMSYLLQDEFAVQTADRVDRGLDLIRKESFAVVVMDIRMPQKNGIQGLEELRRIDGEVAVIMMTGYGALASAQAAMSLGANEYLKKPFDVDVLQAAVRRHARGSRTMNRAPITLPAASRPSKSTTRR